MSNIKHLWSKQTPVFNANIDGNFLQSLTTDSGGNIYVAYNTINETFVSGGSARPSMGGEGEDLVIFKLAPDGTHIWSRQTPVFNSISDDDGASMRIDHQGNLIVSYTTDETGVFGQVSGGSNSNTGSIVVMKLRGSDGVHIWSIQTPVFSTSFATSTSLDLDNLGNIYVSYSGETAVSGGSRYPGSSDVDIIVFKLNNNGELQWNSQTPVFNTNNQDSSPSLGVDNAGDAFVAYETLGQVSGGTLNGGIIVFKLNGSNGEHLWSQQNINFNVADNGSTPSLSIGPDNNVVIAYVSGGEIMGGSAVNFNNDVLLTKLSGTDGTVLWTSQSPIFNTPSNDLFPSVAIASDGTVYVASYTGGGSISGGSVFMGGIPNIAIAEFNGNNGVFISSIQQPYFGRGVFDLKLVADIDNNLILAYEADIIVSGGSAVSLNPMYGVDEIVVVKFSTNKQVVICVHEDMIVDELGIPIKDVTSYGDDFVGLISTGKTDKFVRLKVGSLDKGVPNKDLYLTPGHKIMYQGKQIPVKKLTFKPGIRLCQLDNPVETYNLCFKKDRKISMHHVQVCQWSEVRFKKLLKTMGWKYVDGVGIIKHKKHPKRIN